MIKHNAIQVLCIPNTGIVAGGKLAAAVRTSRPHQAQPCSPSSSSWHPERRAKAPANIVTDVTLGGIPDAPLPSSFDAYYHARILDSGALQFLFPIQDTDFAVGLKAKQGGVWKGVLAFERRRVIELQENVEVRAHWCIVYGTHVSTSMITCTYESYRW